MSGRIIPYLVVSSLRCYFKVSFQPVCVKSAKNKPHRTTNCCPKKEANFYFVYERANLQGITVVKHLPRHDGPLRLIETGWYPGGTCEVIVASIQDLIII